MRKLGEYIYHPYVISFVIIGGSHWAWLKLGENPRFNPSGEPFVLPPVRFYRLYMQKREDDRKARELAESANQQQQ